MRCYLFFAAMLALTLTSGVPSPVRAEEPARWLFVPLIVQQRDLSPWIASALDELGHSAEAKGVNVWSRDDAAQLFERRHSSELSPVTPDDMETLERLSDSAVKSMAAQHHAAALHELDAASRLYQRAPEEFNRLSPRLVLDMCLFRARALIETGEQILKVKQGIRDCRIRIPLEIEPNLLTHTNPTIRKLLTEVSAELTSARSGRLMVRGAPGCPVRVDGVEAGRLRGGQIQFDNLLIGTHRVSVACEGVEPRIYAVAVTGAETVLSVDGSLDASLRSRPYLHLNVESTTPQAEVARVGRVIAEVLKDASVVIAAFTPQGPVVLRRLTPLGETLEAKLAAPAQIGEAWSPEQRDAAIEALLRRPPERSVAPELARPAPAEPAPRPSARLGLLGDRELVRWKRASGGLLAIAGASTVTAVALHLKARAVRSERRDDYDDRLQGDSPAVARARRMSSASVGLSTLGGVSLAAGLLGPLLRRDEFRRPNLALLVSLSAVGAGLLGASVYPFMHGRDACTSCAAARDNHTENGFLLAGSGLGLLAAPVLFSLLRYLPTRSLRQRTETSWGLMPGGASLRGTF